MLGRDLKLTAYVVLNELAEEGVVLVVQQIIKSNPRTDKYLFDLGELFDFLDKLYVFGVVGNKIFARCGGEAFSRCTNAVLKLLFAGRIAEIRRRTADVVNISLKIGKLGYLFCLLYDALNAS